MEHIEITELPWADRAFTQRGYYKTDEFKAIPRPLTRWQRIRNFFRRKR